MFSFGIFVIRLVNGYHGKDTFLSVFLTLEIKPLLLVFDYFIGCCASSRCRCCEFFLRQAVNYFQGQGTQTSVDYSYLSISF